MTGSKQNNELPPIFCFSHLRWNSVFQRPHHLMSRFARARDVYFVEEPVPGPESTIRIETCSRTGVRVCVPVLAQGEGDETMRRMLDGLLAGKGEAAAWYYTPAMRSWSAHVTWRALAYDVMDELSAFRFARADLPELERRLIAEADVVFTGGRSLYEAKKHLHANIHCFPSGVDRAHFAQALAGLPDPADQAEIMRPRLGYFGVIDERLDLDLIGALAEARPDWQVVMIGPVVKVRDEDLPRGANIHWLGGRDYKTLPSYLSNWDVALMPFALNEATRFISPTKAPEYLAGGKPVVSTPVADVVTRYEGIGAVEVVKGHEAFIAACERTLSWKALPDQSKVDQLLDTMSWDGIHAAMAALLHRAAQRHGAAAPALRVVSAKAADYLVVGAGFAGAVMAERIASAGHRVLVVDRRDHIAGNAYDHQDAAGILIHKYGPHIFHTNSDEVLAYLSRFTQWRPYEHRVLAEVEGQLLPMPINRTTLSRLFEVDLPDDAAAEAFLKSLAEPVGEVKTAKDFVISAVGRRLYELFFEGYTRKQWGLDPSQLDRSVTARVPTRTSADDRYFTDKHQCMPLHGYTRMFENMLDHRNITVMTGVDFREVPRANFGHLVYTGPVDAYFDHRYGRLPYRSLRFEHETVGQEWALPVGTVNQPSADVPFTRTTEFKHLTGQSHRMSSLCREFPMSEGDPYYPIPNPENAALYKRYEALADAEKGVTFLGRLGTYRYMNMDQVVGQALATARRLIPATRDAGAPRTVIQVAAPQKA
ncbi:UDP-galactopyranose mutase [Sabulicella glaciei]|nr:UDP-galactopyranose mutase [Roseococcus sp. MDT2-1-1]